LKNIKIRHIVRKAEIANEFLFCLEIAKEFIAEGISVSNTVAHYESEYSNYINCLPSEYLNAKNKKRLLEEIRKLEPLSRSSAKSLVSSVLNKYGTINGVSVINYAKKGLSEGATQKADVHVTVYLPNENYETLMFSLKQYEKFSDPQVASGTYLSTVCGLAFDIAGRGTFYSATGDIFVSKKSNKEQIIQNFAALYGTATGKFIDQIVVLTDKTHLLRKEPVRPANLAMVRKKIGHSAVSPIMELMKIVQNTDPDKLKRRFLDRSGLTLDKGKNMIYSAYSGKGIVTFNTLSDHNFRNLLTELNSDDTTMVITQSGTAQEGQGLSFRFMNNDKVVLVCDMPLTININGAWAAEDRWCSKSDCYVKKDHIRPGKAKELATSTNVWVKLKKVLTRGE
jgi:hypothetical protein